MHTGEVVETAGASLPFAVLISSDGVVVGNFAVASQATGERVLADVLAALAAVEALCNGDV